MDEDFTLRQGLQQFYEEHMGYLSHNKEGIPENVKNFFKSHDIAHVLFGCDLSLFGEGAVKIWTIFGTTLGFWSHLKAYKMANAYELAGSFTLSDVTSNIFKLLLSLPILLVKAKQMNKPWPWSGFEPYMDIAIVDIRKEFNINVF